MSDAAERYCRDFLDDDKPCKCELFSEPVDPNARRLCRECQHGYSKHPQTTAYDRSSQVKSEGLGANARLVQLLRNPTGATTRQARTEALHGFNVAKVSKKAKVITPSRD